MENAILFRSKLQIVDMEVIRYLLKKMENVKAKTFGIGAEEVTERKILE